MCLPLILMKTNAMESLYFHFPITCIRGATRATLLQKVLCDIIYNLVYTLVLNLKWFLGYLNRKFKRLSKKDKTYFNFKKIKVKGLLTERIANFKKRRHAVMAAMLVEVLVSWARLPVPTYHFVLFVDDAIFIRPDVQKRALEDEGIIHYIPLFWVHVVDCKSLLILMIVVNR